MRDYGKVHTSFWSSATTRSLSEDGRTLAMYLLTCPHGTIAGVFRLPDGYACEDLQWEPKRVQEGFAELLENGFANRCETTKWVWVTKHLEWNQPENPNQRKAVAKIATQVPAECAWNLDFMRVCGKFWGAETPAEAKGLETVKQPFLNQEQEQEQEQEQNILSSPTKVADLVPDCPHQKILALWAEHCPTLTQPKRSLWPASDGARALTARWRWVLTGRDDDGNRMATNEAQGLAWFARFFEYVAGCPHLVGQNDRGWTADLAWAMKPANFAKVMQGNYERRREVA